MVNWKKLFLIGIILTVFVSNVGLGLAADNGIMNAANGSSGGGLKLTTSTFTDNISWQQLDSIKPLASLIILVVLFLYGITAFIGPIVGGAKINLASITKSNDLRNEGQAGILHVVFGLLLMCVALIGIFILWNNFGPGTW
ncbi:MAG: hypothetical protein PHN69_03520 [Candidatus Pacebacteria bacterium]|nr:hypothetical protein [Fermentimonas sp.]MDD4804219.1 hypothetical protein [Candidatus Paceibacterota bacterium]